METVASGVLAGGTDNAIECDALNATYANKNDIDPTTFKFTGYLNSTAHDAFAEILGDDESLNHFFKSSSPDSFKYTVSYPDSLNCDTHTPTSFANNSTGSFSAYIYKTTSTTATGYAEYNKLNANALPKPRKHHTFNGYFTAQTGGEKVFNADTSFNTSADLSGITENDVTLYAQWTPGNVKISYHATPGTGTISGGSMADKNVPYGNTTTLTKNTFSQIGHEFKGWATSSGGVKTYNDEENISALYDDLDLYTCWTTNSYTVTYNANGGLGTMSPQTVSYDNRNDYLSSNRFRRDGYNFRGWSLKQDAVYGTDPVYTLISKVDDVLKDDAAASTDNEIKTDPYIAKHNAVTLNAVWEKGKYTINYVDEINPAAFAENPEIRECGNFTTPLPVRSDVDGHDFKGWSTERNGTVAVEKGKAPTSDLAENGNSTTLYAIYRTHTFTIKYIKSQGDEGPEMNDTSCTYGSTLSSFRDCEFTRPGCKFVGWKETASNSSPTAIVLNSSESANINSTIDYSAGQNTSSIRGVADNGTVYVYPVWQKETYTIHYQGDGATNLSDRTYEYGDTITLPTLTMANHTFKGWMESDTSYDAGDTINTGAKGIARNLTFTARWDNDHFITISPDSYIKSITANVNGVAKTLVTNGTLTSMTFKGGEQFTNIVITSIDNQLIKAYKISNDSGTSLAADTLSKAASTVNVSKTVTFPTGSNMNIAITPEAQKYKLTFNTDGGTIIGTTPETYTYGQGLELPTYVVKDGSKFYGWKNSVGSIVTSISKTQAGDLTFTASWTDPNITGLPQGATAVVSTNGKYLTITYANKTTEDVNIAAQGIALKNGSNAIQFKTADGKSYLTNVNYTAPTDLPSTIKATYVTGATTATITYPDGTTQSVAVNKYNSETTLYGTKIYFDGVDGKRYAVIPGDGTGVSPTPSASPAPTSSPGNNQKPSPDEYYMISKVSYNVKNGKASATNPYDWNATAITIKSTVNIYGKNYKVTKIAPEAFYGMLKLKKLVIGKNVRSIGTNAARDCKKLKLIKIMSGDITSMGKNWLRNIAKNAYVYIKAPKKKYKKLRDTIRKKSGCPKSTHFRRIKS